MRSTSFHTRTGPSSAWNQDGQGVHRPADAVASPRNNSPSKRESTQAWHPPSGEYRKGVDSRWVLTFHKIDAFPLFKTAIFFLVYFCELWVRTGVLRHASMAPMGSASHHSTGLVNHDLLGPWMGDLIFNRRRSQSRVPSQPSRPSTQHSSCKST